MIGKILEIEESAFGGDIITITHPCGGVIESRMYLNAGEDYFIEGDFVEYTEHYSELSKTYFARNLIRAK